MPLINLIKRLLGFAPKKAPGPSKINPRPSWNQTTPLHPQHPPFPTPGRTHG